MFFGVMVPIGLVAIAIWLFVPPQSDSSGNEIADAMGLAVGAVVWAFKVVIGLLLLIISGILVWFVTIPYGHTQGWW